ncbi:hypothetical protein MAPG_07089 [Magnaporthiopsis poae ATCC 64411]|uniref:DUF7707 domain-containing protein n=1 Tax=Magnaporthiopsis poae (strain ATCC 64411 / 73-15) TaxID=644358 RepID=A0A0C4E3S0_MAGP6|nr:hypothetical protein MAPG_07089 [Magnaporthiopsis poae ATCC 64411]
MVSLRSTLLAAAAIVVGVQADYPIQASSVPLSTRNAWCTNQKSQCPPICLDMAPASGWPIKNTCEAATLNYECVCGNNASPNLTEYSLTIPYYKCVQYQENCVTNCGLANNACSDTCRKDIKCGASSPNYANSLQASLSLAVAITGVLIGPLLFVDSTPPDDSSCIMWLHTSDGSALVVQAMTVDGPPLSADDVSMR